jgi:hypothetical protein
LGPYYPSRWSHSRARGAAKTYGKIEFSREKKEGVAIYFLFFFGNG